MRFADGLQLDVEYRESWIFVVDNNTEYKARIIYMGDMGTLRSTTLFKGEKHRYYGQPIFIFLQNYYRSDTECWDMPDEAYDCYIVPLYDGRDMAEGFVREMNI